jgi:septum site-determining protein MinC
MPIDRTINERNSAAPNGSHSERVQAKLTALLDDVTVTATPAAERTDPPLSDSDANEPTHTNTPDAPTLPIRPEVAQIAAQIRSIQAGGGQAVNDDTGAPVKNAPPVGPGAVSIKGRGEGVAVEMGKGPWADVMEELRIRLDQAGSFFRGGSVALDVGGRPLLESELDEVRLVLGHSGLTLAMVRTSAERTFKSAIALGLAARLASGDESDAEVEPAASNQGFSHYFVYRGNLRSGQVLERNEHIMVVGDVNPGAEVVSHGDILVWGRMRGIAHAGASGDRRSVVVALHLDPIQLRIAGTIAIDLAQVGHGSGRRSWKNSDKRPEVAYITNDQIVIEAWDESKPGGLAAFRRN